MILGPSAVAKCVHLRMINFCPLSTQATTGRGSASGIVRYMARVDKLPLHVLESVAIHAANALASTERGSSKLDEADASLNESFPIWLMTGSDLERLRLGRDTVSPDMRHYFS